MPNAVRWLRWVAVLMVVVFAILHVPALYAASPPWLLALLVNGVNASAATLALTRVVRRAENRLGWALIAAGLCLYTSATLLTWIITWRGDTLRFPSIADVGWLGFYPLAYAGTLVFLRRRTTVRRALMDGAIAGLGGAALFSAFVVDMLITTRTSALALAYPLGDALLFGTLLCRIAVDRGGTGRRSLMTLGIAVFIAADSAYVMQVTAGNYHPGSVTDIFYVAGLLLIGMHAWQRDEPPAAPAMQRVVRLGLPVAGALSALAVLLVASRVPLSNLTVGLAALCLTAVVGRVAAAFRELESVGEARHLEARRDPLTGLLNRRAINEHLAQRLTDPEPLALMLLDLDRFKQVNDEYGHHAGDDLLQQASTRLLGAVRAADVCGRLGGDEFVVIARGIPGEAVAGMAERIRAALSRPFAVAGARVTIDVSIGIALAPLHAEEPAELTRCADAAMYDAKRAGGGHRVWADRRPAEAGGKMT